MLRIAGEEELVVVALVGEDLGETLVRQRPVVHSVGHGRDGVEVILVPGLEPDADRLDRAVRNKWRSEVLIGLRNGAAFDAEIGDRRSRPWAMILPGAAGQSGV